MYQLLDIAKMFLNQNKINPRGILADFTMGNGYDTLYLCSLVPEGKVYGFDIQNDALVNTRKRLDEASVTTDVTLICDSHSELKKYIGEEIDGGMFNLGYLPGGDKSIHTSCDSTLMAVRDAIDILKKGGVLVISVYPGHPEGKVEGEMLLDMLEKYDKKVYGISRYHIVNSSEAPFVITIEKYDK